MKIVSGKVEGLRFQQAHFIGGEITPDVVVLHDTAGRLTKFNSANYLASNNPGKASVHFVIERDGAITQQVPTDRRANHAGKSTFHGRDGVNDFSIGIEIVNPGKMVWADETHVAARAWYGQVFEAGPDCALHWIETPEHGRGVWMAYTEEQIAALLDLLAALFRDIPSLREITTHWYVSPGRKVDVNPTFPLASVRRQILGHDDPEPKADTGKDYPTELDEMVQIDTPGDQLNMRRWPSFNPNVIGAIPHETVVPVLRSGMFGGRHWHLVLYAGQEGWVSASYTAPIIFSET